MSMFDKIEVVIYAMLVGFAGAGLVAGVVACNIANAIVFAVITVMSICILKIKLNEIKNK